MTTIATDGRSMAGDGLLTCHGTIHGYAFLKVRLLSDGRIMGYCGNAYALEQWVDWVEDSEGKELPAGDADSIEFLVLDTDGTCLCYNGYGQWYPQNLPAAIGSGANFALAAMRAGADPTEAVDIAAHLCTKTGGLITTEWIPGHRPLVKT